jgi:hypothetical protein
MAIINLHSESVYETVDGKLTRIEPSATTYTPWFADNAQATSWPRNQAWDGKTGYTTYLSHIGLCLFDYERNGYDDSDFFMAVWNPVKGEREDICFATTRGWSYPCYGSKPDATEETKAAYDAWRAKLAAQADERRAVEAAAAKEKLAVEATKLAKHVGCTVARIEALRAAMGDDYGACVKLLNTKAFRSEFRASLCTQIKKWLMDDNPAHATPLSYKQRQYL